MAAPLFLLLARKAWGLRYPDLAWSYPFVSFDGYQWMLEGLYLRGQDVATFGRNPGFPAILALLDSVFAMHLLPLVHVALLAVFLFLCFRLAGRHASEGAAALAALLVGCSFSVQTFFDWVLADPWAITFLAAAMLALEQAPRRPARLLAAAFFAALSFLCQYAVAFVLPAIAVFVSLRVLPREGDRRSAIRSAALAVLLGAALVAPVFVFKWLRFGDPLWTTVVQFQLVAPHLFGLPHYAVCALAFLGAPAALSAALGLGLALRSPGRALLPLMTLACFGAFWILLYQWLDPRFLLYLLAPGVVFLSLGLDALGLPAALSPTAGWPRRLAAALAVVFAMLLAGFPRVNPFESSRLPLTPWHALVFRTHQITEWSGNWAIDWSGLPSLERVDGSRPAALRFWADHWRDARAKALATRDLTGEDLLLLRDRAERVAGDHFHVSACLAVPPETTEKWRREITLRRSLLACGAPSDVVIRERAPPAGAELIGSGSRLLLTRPGP